ncbi:DUF928 domain-containing protein [Microcoleus sp. FACHB-1515]|uniref:DUF928 domain-containing protein n=1 Tax=Cyanophyceae TaxID=3028117 RepID=UPI001686FF45|nr:DUF928 domain-containing protein [Microcoleus sp. FACHB-1515]MBD2088580.1 DUF928 domain-containing protein [Microcoleus sp. FACHB-1515]
MNRRFVSFSYLGLVLAIALLGGRSSLALDSSGYTKSLTFSDTGQPTSPTTPPSSLATRGCLQELLAVSPKPTEIAAQPEACALPGEETPTRTVSEFPTFWFYVPDQGGQVSAELTLFDPQGQPLRQQIVLSGEAGIVGIRLAQPIEVDRDYTWRFRINETPGEASMNPFVRGTVRRISLDPALAAQLEAASAQEQIALYAANGIWQETLTALIQLRQTQPNHAQLQTDWSSLLDSVNLGSIANAPILDCCTSQPVAD